MNQFRSAIDSWNRDVDAEAARLVRDGYGPWEAARMANDIVSARRKEAAAVRPVDLNGLFGGRHD